MRLAAFILLLAAAPALPQPADPLPWPEPAPVPELSGQAFASLLTMLPGEEVYSLFGHTALRVADPALDLDRTYNYGVFDFDQPHFVLRFLGGRLDYQLAISTFDRTLAEYRFLDRPVIEQRLALTSDELQRLFLFVETNHLPENRVYRYDFLFDNCSTRPRDAIAWATEGRLSFGDYRPPEGSFRELVKPYTAADPLLDFGVDLGFGRPVDREPTPWEAIFLPLELFDAFEEATIGDRAAVASTDTLFWLPGAGLPDPAPDIPALLASLLLIIGIGLTLWPAAPPRVLRGFDGALLMFAGLLGLLLSLMWFASAHYVTHVNVDLLWAWPTHLVAVALILRTEPGRRTRAYFAAAAAGAGTGGLLGLIGLLAMHPAAIPLALLTALRCAARARPVTPLAAPASTEAARRAQPA